MLFYGFIFIELYCNKPEANLGQWISGCHYTFSHNEGCFITFFRSTDVFPNVIWASAPKIAFHYICCISLEVWTTRQAVPRKMGKCLTAQTYSSSIMVCFVLDCTALSHSLPWQISRLDSHRGHILSDFPCASFNPRHCKTLHTCCLEKKSHWPRLWDKYLMATPTSGSCILLFSSTVTENVTKPPY